MIQKHFDHIGLGSCLLYFFIVCVTGLNDHSATYDEPIYISSGIAASEFGDFRLKLDTPPLVPYLARLGAGFDALRHTPPDLEILRSGMRNLGVQEHYTIAREYFHSAPNVPSLLLAARFPFVLTAMIGLVYVWLLGRAFTNELGAFLATALLALDPTWQAHASVVACDVPLGVLFAMSVYHLTALLRSPGIFHAVMLGLAIALSMLTKYNAPLLFPILAGICAFNFLASKRLPLREVGVAAICSILLFFVFAGYLYGGLANLSVYFGGYSTIYANVPESNVYYLWGEFSKKTWMHYYPLATLIKLPLIHLLLILAGITIAFAQSASRRVLVNVAIPIIVVFGVSLFDKTNYCMRRILPAFPFLYLFPAFIGPCAASLSPKTAVIVRRALGVAVGFALLANLISLPNQMSFIGILFGGNGCGPRLLSDCNLDWGQDLPALADYQRENNISDLVLVYFGQAEPKSYGISYREMIPPELEKPRNSVYAISANVLIYQQLEADRLNQPSRNWLDRFEPTAIAGGSIYIYDFREPGRVVEK